MHIEEFRDYCLSKTSVTEETPFNPDTLVFKVQGKIFTLTDINTFKSINLKCDPTRAVALRENYPAILPGYHMNKKHWNTVMLDYTIPATLLKELIDHSYALVAAGLPKKAKLFK